MVAEMTISKHLAGMSFWFGIPVGRPKSRRLHNSCQNRSRWPPEDRRAGKVFLLQDMQRSRHRALHPESLPLGLARVLRIDCSVPRPQMPQRAARRKIARLFLLAHCFSYTVIILSN